MPNLETVGKVKKATEKTNRVEDNGKVEASYEITFHLQLERRDYLRLARAGLNGDDLLLTIDVTNFQMSLDDMWHNRQEGVE